MNIQDINIGDTVWCTNYWNGCDELATVIAICNDDTVLVEYDEEGVDYYSIEDITLATLPEYEESERIKT